MQTGLEIHAQTNIQLYQQLQESGCPEAELERIRSVYEFVSSRFAGRYQFSGRPFLCHLVGTASIVARVTRRPALAAAGLVHSVHRTKESRDGSRELADSVRQPIIDAVGAELERYALGFFQARHHYDSLRQRVGELQPFEADVATLLLCDDLEKLSSRNILYSNRPEERIRKFRQKSHDMVALARELGHAALADDLSEALDAIFSAEIPRVLRHDSGS